MCISVCVGKDWSQWCCSQTFFQAWHYISMVTKETNTVQSPSEHAYNYADWSKPILPFQSVVIVDKVYSTKALCFNHVGENFQGHSRYNRMLPLGFCFGLVSGSYIKWPHVYRQINITSMCLLSTEMLLICFQWSTVWLLSSDTHLSVFPKVLNRPVIFSNSLDPLRTWVTVQRFLLQFRSL